MKKLFLSALACCSLSAFAELPLESFGIHRLGGGHMEAIVRSSTEGPEIRLLKCNFRDARQNQTVKVTGTKTIKEVIALMDGTAIIASDMSPQLQLETGSWFQMSYTAQRSGGEAVEVASPLIIIKGRLSNVLLELEKQARVLCK